MDSIPNFSPTQIWSSESTLSRTTLSSKNCTEEAQTGQPYTQDENPSHQLWRNRVAFTKTTTIAAATPSVEKEWNSGPCSISLVTETSSHSQPQTDELSTTWPQARHGVQYMLIKSTKLFYHDAPKTDAHCLPILVPSLLLHERVQDMPYLSRFLLLLFHIDTGWSSKHSHSSS